MTKKQYYLEHKEQWKEYNRKWYAAHGDYKRQMGRDRDLEKKLVVLDYYSRGALKCTHCGIDDIDVLTIDHINGGGHQDRLVNGSKTYRYLINQDFPEGYQVLCFNCNWKKRLNQKESKKGE
uniref:Uncharacterized protein n=1 Tax=viral metagenome TaxID=1070528 RepID=A0A6M3K8C1_9ZZZZ